MVDDKKSFQLQKTCLNEIVFEPCKPRKMDVKLMTMVVCVGVCAHMFDIFCYRWSGESVHSGEFFFRPGQCLLVGFIDKYIQYVYVFCLYIY